MPDTLRIGVLLDGELAPAWVVDLLARIAAVDGVEVALILTAEDLPATQPEDVGDWDGSSRSAVWRLWLSLERQLYRDTAQHFRLQPLPPALRGVARLSIPAGSEPAAAPLSMLRHLRQQNLDVLVQLGLSDWGVPLCGVATHGLWRLRSGDTQRGRRGPPGFWEVRNLEGATHMCLEMLSPDQADGRVLADGGFTSDDHSVLQNRVAHYIAGSGLLVRELSALWQLGAEAWQADVTKRLGGVVAGGAVRGMPGLAGAALAFLRVYGRVVLRKLRERLTREQWQIHYSQVGQSQSRQSQSLQTQSLQTQSLQTQSRQPQGAQDAPDTRFARFRRIEPPADRIWADPFVVQRRGRTYVFFEEMLHREQRGVLSCLELRADGGWTEPRRVLERPFHLSYPNVFEHGNEWYMLPETSAARCVELYRAAEFPWRWEKVRTLIPDIELVDATLWQHEGRWWLFGNVRTQPGMTLQDALHIYSTDDLLDGAWTPHPENPVVLDATSARPAGRLWLQDGRLIRPAQDSTFRYGYALKLFEITALTPTTYRERLLQRFEPDWAGDMLGVHTLNFAGGTTVIDGLVRRTR